MAFRIKPIEKNNKKCEDIIRKTCQGVLSLSCKNEPYAIPLNHAYEDGMFYFHCPAGGKKIDFLKSNPSVVYTIVRNEDTLDNFKGKSNCHDGKWESIIVYGRAKYIENERELKAVFIKFMKYYGKEDYKPAEMSLKSMKAIVLEVEKMTVRKRLETKITEFYEWEKKRR